jgi:4'-phosphopantetheinyl transferase
MRIRWERLDGRSGHEVGRQLLRQLYEEETGGELPEIRIANRGKPYFADSSLHFSISHTKHHVFCVLSSCPVGIDAEELIRQVKPALAEKILSTSERIRYDACTDKNEALLRFWVLKEAMAKFTGKGIRGYPNKTDFRPDDPRIQILSGCLVAIIQEETYAL